MQRNPPQQPPRGAAAFHALAAPSDPVKTAPTAQLHVLKAKAERARVTLEGLMQQVLVDDGNPNVKYMPEWQSILKGYQNVLLQLQDISTYIATTTIRPSPNAPPINPFSHSLVHLQAPISSDNDSIGRLEYMAVPARLPSALQEEQTLADEEAASRGWPKDEQIAAMMPQELGEVHDTISCELADTRRRMARAGAILGQLQEGFDWRKREVDEGEDDEMELEDEEAEGAATVPAASGADAKGTPASGDDLFGDSSQSTPAAATTAAAPAPSADAVIELSDDSDTEGKAGERKTDPVAAPEDSDEDMEEVGV